MTIGSFHAVGLGSGDPETITRSAIQVLKKSDYIFAPRSTRSTRSHALERLKTIDSFQAEIVEYELSMKEGEERLDQEYNRTAEDIHELIENGQMISAVTIGDPLFYSTAGRLVETLRERLPLEIIEFHPGIHSSQAAASRLKSELVQGNESFAIAPVNDEFEDLPTLLSMIDTVALLKVHKSFSRIYSVLKQCDRLSNSYLVEKLGSPAESIRSLKNVNEKYDPPYFSLIFVR